MYSRCGSLSFARQLFDKTPDRDLVTWNSILAGYAHSADSEVENVKEGFRLFRLLRGSAVVTSRHTLAPVLKLCLLSGYVWASEAVHGYAVKIGLGWDVFVSGALVNIYSKFGRIREARVLFDCMEERDVVLWNVMLKACVEMGLYKEALCLFSSFHRSELHPDDVSVRCVLNAINNVGSDEGNRLAEQVKAYAIKLVLNHDNSDVFKWNKTLSEYLQAGENWAAVQCFINMIRSKVEYDSVTFVVILSAIAGANDLEMGQQVHGVALKSGFDFIVSVANSLINMYSKAGSLYFARKVFNYMKEMDLISWNSMISSCAQSSLNEEAVNLFIDLLHDGLRPDQFTIASVLRACSSFKEGSYLCKQIHVHAIKTGIIADSFVSTALIDVYSRSGNMKEAEFLFENKGEFDLASWNAMMFGYIMSNDSQKALNLFSLIHENGERADQITLATAAKASGLLNMESAHMVFTQIPVPDDVAWTTMISGCVENGDEDRALSIYHQMRLSGVQPDEYTFATLVKASSCLTALEHGRQIQANVIKLDYALDPFVGTSLIDMYAKCGNIGDAYLLFQRMKLSNIALWNAMLIGLAQHGNAKEALNLFKAMESNGIEPDKVTFIGVLSACSHSGLISEAYEYFDSMSKKYGVKPEIEHYSCLVDALGRVGRVQEAEKLIGSMPFEAYCFNCIEPCLVLVGFKGTQKLEKGSQPSSWNWSHLIHLLMFFYPISMLLPTNGMISHPQTDLIYDKVEDLIQRIREEGYVPDTDFTLLDVEE
uniref:Pentatricopeptide repeat-containing protein n=1 Tax=Fagus sylvatica TaxID=28930 RepID=A0A2N9FJ12_FAGSY